MFNFLKGWVGEKLTTFGLWLTLDERVYHRIDDVIVPGRDGTTQIDHVLVSVFGVFVIETKNLQGWIFGDEHSKSWCQCLHGNKFQFQNPLHQNRRHIRCLVELLRLPESCFHSVVFFGGECEFKTPMPPNVLSYGVVSYIKGFQRLLLPPAEVDSIEGVLRSLKAPDSRISRREHLASLEARHAAAPEKCPECGGKLVTGVARRGQFEGQSFVGCSNFPRCRYTTR